MPSSTLAPAAPARPRAAAPAFDHAAGVIPSGIIPAAPGATSEVARGAPAAFPAARALRVLQVGLALFFLFAGADSLADSPAIGADFELLTDLTGAGAWLRLSAGSAEVLGAALLLVPAARAAGVGALLLGALMAATAVAYVAVLHAAPVLPLVLLTLLAVVVHARRDALAEVGDFLVRNL